MKAKYIYFYFISILLYLFIHFKTLLSFPLVHSDEPWLGGLSLEYLNQKSVFVTETFFNVFPRTPHLIKIFFHSIQAFFISVFGYSIFSLRLLSLIFAFISLLLIYKLFIQLKLTRLNAYLGAILLGTNIQFIYAAHFARQEIILLALLIASYLAYQKKGRSGILVSALCIGLSVGFHPNAFILALMIGLCLIIDVIHQSISIKAFFFWSIIVILIAAIFPTITLLNNPEFIQDYFAYGQTLSVDAPLFQRITNMTLFYQKLFLQVSGTYYLPNIRFVFLSLILIALFTLYTKTYKHRYWQHGVAMIIGFNLGIFVIGRFNTTSIVFILFPWTLLMIHELIYLSHKLLSSHQVQKSGILVIACIISLLSLTQFFKEEQRMSQANYPYYLMQIKENLTFEGAILGNLSSGFVFNNRDFYDIRNLAYLDSNQVYHYIEDHHIKTIIYYEEYDYIHRNPMWNILYGSDTGYYDQLQQFLQENASLAYEFEAPYYGTRIIRYMGDYPWKVQIYHVDRMPTY